MLSMSKVGISQNAHPDLDSNVVNVERGIVQDSAKYVNQTAGEFTPGRGFDVVKTNFGSLNISLYAIARYLNQMPGEQTFEDHLGREHDITGRNDIYWHRAMIWFSGFIGTPKLKYSSTIWTIFTTQQTLIYGQIHYEVNKHLQLGIGVLPNLCIRSLQGPFPFYSSTDRTMGEDALRGGFTGGFRAIGEIVPKLHYSVMIGNNLSTLGIKAANLTRDLSKSASIWWMPTTGEFGPRGGIGDLENHQKVATRFGASFCYSKEDRFNNIGEPSPDNTQVRLSDGILFFETGALADGVTVDVADFAMLAVDLGVKYKGFNAQAEIYARNLYNIEADGPVPEASIKDFAYSLQISQMIVPKKVMLYAVNSYFWDAYDRNPYEIGGGVNLYFLESRSWRINAQAVYVHKTAAGGSFGLYTAGQTGPTITIGTDILL